MNNTKIQHILIPVDFLKASDCAVEYGAYLTKLFPADILLLHILEGVHAYPPGWFNSKDKAPDIKSIRKKISGKLDEYARDITKNTAYL